MGDKLYLVSYDMQAKEIKKYCFRECGKILIGDVKIVELIFLPCNTNDCPFFEKQIKTLPITFNGIEYKNVYIRKLKELKNME